MFTRVVAIMAAMAGGDRAAVFALYEEFGGTIAGVVRREARRQGIELSARDLDELVIDACFVLLDCAGGWSADGGALPWTWAFARLRTLVASRVGVHADSLDALGRDGAPFEPAGDWAGAPLRDAGVPGNAAGASADPEELPLLEALASWHGGSALLREALGLVASERDRRLVLEVRVQADLGDPAPAKTVAAEHGLRADAVRQAVKRTLDRLRALAATEPRFAPLAAIPLLAA